MPKENLIVNNFIQKKYLAQEIRLENCISHKHIYQVENTHHDLGYCSGQERGLSKC